MKKILLILAVTLFTSSAFAGSCPMLAGQVQTKIEEAKKLHDEGVKEHSISNHANSEKLLKKALNLFKG